MGSPRDDSTSESLASRFERLWEATGTAPDLKAFLQLHSDASLRERAEVVRVDQRRRWQAGQPRVLEDYFRAFPDLAAHAGVKLALAVAEYRTASRNGRAYDRDAFLARFADLPSLSERLADARPTVGPSPVGVPPNASQPTAGGASPAATPRLAARRFVQDDDLVVVRPPETEGVYDFVDDDGILAVEPALTPIPALPRPRVVHTVQEDSDFGSANQKGSKTWSQRVLARRATAWHTDPSFRTIPMPWEWASILLRTDRRAWTRRQRDVMASAGRFYLIGTLALAIGLTGVGLASRFLGRRPRVPIPLALIEPIDARELTRYVKQLDEIKTELAANRGARANELLDQVDARWRDWEWRHLKLACHPRTFEVATPGPFVGLPVSADARRLAISCDLFVPGASSTDGHFEGRLQLWDLDKHPIRELTTFSSASRFLRVVLSADGHRVAAATETAIHVWDVDKAKEILRMSQPARSLAHLSLAPDGAQLAFADSNGPVTLWNIPSGEKIHTLGQKLMPFARLVFAPRGRRLVAEAGNQIALWDTVDGHQILLKETKHRSGGGIAVFSADGQRLAATDEKGVVRLWDTETGKDLATFGTLGDGTGSLAFSPDGKQLAGSVAGEWTVILWDTETGQKNQTFTMATSPGNRNSFSTSLQDITFSPDGARLAAFRASDTILAKNHRSVLIWDMKSGGAPETVSHAAQPQFTTGGRMVFSSDAVSQSQNGLGVWDPSGAHFSVELAEAGAPSPDGSRLVAIGSNQIVSTDDGRVLKALNKIAPVNFTDVYFNPNGRRYVTIDREKSMRFWDAATDTPLGEGQKTKERLVQFLFSGNGDRLITVGSPQRGEGGDPSGLGGLLSNNAVLTIWDPERGGEPLVTVQGLYHRFSGRLSISPDGKQFATGSLHETVRVYDTDSGSVTWDLEGHTETVYGSVFSPDGRHLITSGLDLLEDRVTKGEVKVWDLETGGMVREFPGPAIVTIISPDGRLAFAADLAGYVRGKPGRQKYQVWDLATGETRYKLDGPMSGLTFTPDGKRFACLDKDAVHLRETTTGIELLSLPLNRAGGGIL